MMLARALAGLLLCAWLIFGTVVVSWKAGAKFWQNR